MGRYRQSGGAAHRTVCDGARFFTLNLLNQLTKTHTASICVNLARELQILGVLAQPALADLLMPTIVLEEWTMWTKPDFTEMRFGFEITMYIGNR